MGEDNLPLIESVSWETFTPDQIAYRFPDLSLRYGSQVIVRENQWAVFFRDGKALDVFGPGRHTITSNNIPLLTAALRALGIIGNIFECEVIFVSNSQFRGNFGGQAYTAPSGNIQYQAEVGFHGYLLFKVEDPKLFVTEFFGNRRSQTSDDVKSYIRGFINERVIDEFGHFDVITLVKNLDETTDKVTALISDEAARAGFRIIDSVFEGLKIPEEARRFASNIGQQAMMMQYMRETASVLPPGGGAASAGVGAGIGLSMAKQLEQATQAQPRGAMGQIVCKNCGMINPDINKFCGNCGNSLEKPPTVKCPKCGAEMPAINKFCGVCGTQLNQVEIECPKCKTKNQKGNKYCSECGTAL